jgi:hypothetical protein
MAQPCSSSERTTQRHALGDRRSTEPFYTFVTAAPAGSKYDRSVYSCLAVLRQHNPIVCMPHRISVVAPRTCPCFLPSFVHRRMPHASRYTSGLRVFALWVGTVGPRQRVPLSLRKVVIAHTQIRVRISNHRSRRKVTPLGHGKKA